MTTQNRSPIRIIQDAIADQLGDRSRQRSGFYAFDYCPFCHKKRKAAIKPGRGGFKCYSCEEQVHTLEEWQHLASVLATPITDAPPPREKAARKEDPKVWQADPMRYHSRYIAPLDLAERWAAYKPISAENVMRYQLGYGTLPPIGRDRNGQPRYTMGCAHKRLTYANIENAQRQPVGFRGRQIECSCYADEPGDLKWITVAGTRAWLWNSYNLAQAAGRWIIVAENPIDGILIEQAQPDIYPLAGTAGAGTWYPEWTQMIAAARPKGVLIWYDNDLIGCPTPETRDLLVEQWIAKMIAKGRQPTAAQIEHQRTKAMGPKISTDLQALAIKAQPYRWAPGTPPKMDSGQHLINAGAV
jgi:hypothetical protein